METFAKTDLMGGNSRVIAAPRRDNSSLRMTPLIDMTFLLLLFFLVAAKWRPKEDFLPLQLPAGQSQPGTRIRPEALVIEIANVAGGCRVLAGQRSETITDGAAEGASTAALTKLIGDCMAEQKRLPGDPIEIACEPEVTWQHLALIYNTLYGMGATDITFRMTEAPSDED